MLPTDVSGGAVNAPGISDALLQNGALGILALVAISAAYILYKGMAAALDREVRGRNALEQELRDLNAKIRTDIVPVLTEATRVIGEALLATRERNR